MTGRIGLLFALLFAAQSWAVTVEPKAKVSLREKPTASSKVVGRVAPGQKLTVVAKSSDERWTKVKAGGKAGRGEGWVPSDQLKAATSENEAESAPAEPLAKERGVRPEAWVSSSKYHESKDQLTVLL